MKRVVFIIAMSAAIFGGLFAGDLQLGSWTIPVSSPDSYEGEKVTLGSSRLIDRTAAEVAHLRAAQEYGIDYTMRCWSENAYSKLYHPNSLNMNSPSLGLELDIAYDITNHGVDIRGVDAPLISHGFIKALYDDARQLFGHDNSTREIDERLVSFCPHFGSSGTPSEILNIHLDEDSYYKTLWSKDISSTCHPLGCQFYERSGLPSMFDDYFKNRDGIKKNTEWPIDGWANFFKYCGVTPKIGSVNFDDFHSWRTFEQTSVWYRISFAGLSPSSIYKSTSKFMGLYEDYREGEIMLWNAIYGTASFASLMTTHDANLAGHGLIKTEVRKRTMSLTCNNVYVDTDQEGYEVVFGGWSSDERVEVTTNVFENSDDVKLESTVTTSNPSVHYNYIKFCPRHPYAKTDSSGKVSFYDYYTDEQITPNRVKSYEYPVFIPGAPEGYDFASGKTIAFFTYRTSLEINDIDFTANMVLINSNPTKIWCEDDFDELGDYGRDAPFTLYVLGKMYQDQGEGLHVGHWPKLFKNYYSQEDEELKTLLKDVCDTDMRYAISTDVVWENRDYGVKFHFNRVNIGKPETDITFMFDADTGVYLGVFIYEQVREQSSGDPNPGQPYYYIVYGSDYQSYYPDEYVYGSDTVVLYEGNYWDLTGGNQAHKDDQRITANWNFMISVPVFRK